MNTNINNGTGNKKYIKKLLLCISVVIIIILCLFRKNIYEIIDIIELKKAYEVKIEKLQSKMTVERRNYKYSQLCDGRILITGGNVRSQNLKSTEIFDPKTKMFSKGPDMNFPHRRHRQYTTNTCDVIIADTNCIETYNYKENKFETWENSSINEMLNTENANIYGVSYFFDYLNNKMLVTGGYLFDKNNKKGKPLKSVFIIDTEKKEVSQIENLPFSIYYHNSILLDGDVLIWGGTSDFSSKFLKFDFKNNEFEIFDFGKSLYTMDRNKCFVLDNNEILCFNYHPDECDKCCLSTDYVPNKYRFIDKINFKTKQREKIKVPPIIFGIEASDDANNEFRKKDGDVILLAENCVEPYLLIYNPPKNKFLKNKIKNFKPISLIKMNDECFILIEKDGTGYLYRLIKR